MLPSDHPAVKTELARRDQLRSKQLAKATATATGGESVVKKTRAEKKTDKEKKMDKDKEKDKDKDNDKDAMASSDAGKWQIAHQQLAESSFSTTKDT